jgi:two-component system, NtrC family, sensor kinase
MDDALRQARNRESIGRFVGNVAHDFNNMLMVFQSGVALLEHPLDAETRKRLLDGMRRAVEQGSTLTRQMRDFSEHRPPADTAIQDVSRLLPGMREKLSALLRAGIRLELDCEPHLDPVNLSPSELELALVNLCLNAQEAMPEGGAVRVAARKAADGVAITVADTGEGIGEEARARAFEPFFSTRGGGALSGLGLSQVYAFAVLADGRVRISSESGRGTTVEITLPRAK